MQWQQLLQQHQHHLHLSQLKCSGNDCHNNSSTINTSISPSLNVAAMTAATAAASPSYQV
jgi:hypothetical protein